MVRNSETGEERGNERIDDGRVKEGKQNRAGGGKKRHEKEWSRGRKGEKGKQKAEEYRISQ